MIAFYLQRTLHSLRRTPGLSSVMIANMALGLAIWIIAYAAVAAHGRLPLTHSDNLFHVDWGTLPASELTGSENHQRILALAPHLLLSDRDANRLGDHPSVRRSARTFTSRLSVRSEGEFVTTAVRFSTHALFGMFQLPFRHGKAWNAAAEASGSAVVVLDADSNERFFGGENSVGRSLEIDGERFRVVGVLAPTPTRMRAYDFSFTLAPAIYLPYPLALRLGVRPDYLARRSVSGGSTAELVRSPDGFVQLWVELGSPEQRPAYEAFLRTAASQQRPSRHPRRSMLQTPAEFIESSVPISSGFLLFRACALIMLLACSVNMSRLLIVKFQARAPELAVQRALGATQRAVFAQHMLEAVLVAVGATALALIIAWLSLLGINHIVPDRPAEFALDLQAVAMACSVGLGAGLLAGIHPAIRMVRSVPATFLRLQ
jgi:putative ABC transport system permease protein